jgi:hypothetical protein
MSRNYAVLEKSGSQLLAPAGRYSDLIARFFQTPAAVAIVSRGDARICEDIAAELAAAGKRVIIVPVNALLRMNPVPVPHQPDYVPGRNENVWLWPSPAGANISFFKSRVDLDPVQWLESLRLNFAAVLLDCPAPGTTPGSAEIAAMADAAVLAAEAGVTTKLQVRQDCQLLQSKGVKLAGTILTRRR